MRKRARVTRQQGWPVSQQQRRQRVQWQQRRGRQARKRGLAGVVRAMAMARKMAMASNKDDNHVDGNDSNNGDDHDDNGVKDGNNDDNADNNDKD